MKSLEFVVVWAVLIACTFTGRIALSRAKANTRVRKAIRQSFLRLLQIVVCRFGIYPELSRTVKNNQRSSFTKTNAVFQVARIVL